MLALFEELADKHGISLEANDAGGGRQRPSARRVCVVANPCLTT